MRYRLAVLDIAGTTVADPGLVARAFAEAMAAAGHAIEVEDVRPLMGYPKPQAIARLLGTTVDVVSAGGLTDRDDDIRADAVAL